MDRRRYLQLVAGHAAAKGEPVHAALDRAAASLGVLERQEGAALLDARSGDLEGCLANLGFASMVREAAAIEPSALATIDARLARLPALDDLSWRFRVVILYLSLVALLQAVVGGMLQATVLPALAAAGGGGLGQPLVVGGALLLWGGLALAGLGVAIRGSRLPGLGGGVATLLERARVSLAAAILLDGGAPIDAVVAWLHRHAPNDVLGGLGSSRQDAPHLTSLAEYFVAGARRGAEDLARRWKVGGTLACLMVAGFFTLTVYVGLAGLSYGG